MADSIICPSCGQSNPPDAVFCENCQWRLKPAISSDDSGDGHDPAKPLEDAELPDWLLKAREDAQKMGMDEPDASAEPTEAGGPKTGGTGDVDLLAGLAAQDSRDDEDVPEWVRRITGMTASEVERQDEADRLAAGPPDSADEAEGIEMAENEDEIASWRLAQEPGIAEVSPEAESEGDEARSTPAADGTNNEIYEWLRKLDAASQQDSSADQDAGAIDESVPEWVRNLGGAGKRPSPAPKPPAETNVPDWLRDMRNAEVGEYRSAAGTEPSPTPGLPESEAEPLTSDELPGGTEKPEESEAHADAEFGSQPGVRALEPEAGEGLDVDAVFASMQLPEWLSDVTPAEPKQEENLPPAAAEESIAPAELPSWVQAMRPVERPAGPAPKAGDEELRLEPGGPLAGLQGVLPAVPGAGRPSSKPGVQAERLEVSDQQRVHADLLESMLETEIRPQPMRTASLLGSQRLLRWAVAGLMVVALAGSVFSKSRVFPLPAAVPNESIHAIETINQIPEGSHVLVVFDYEPATVGEMEATAASLLDHLLLLRHPVLAVISTSPTGSALAERFMTGALAERTYERGQQYMDLGYLPGGLAGVRAFADSPTTAISLGAAADPVWASPLLQGVTHLSDFSAILVLTDGLESGRVWIEQTAAGRGSTPLVVVSSAQAGPMLLPYEDAGQINGLLSGIYGAAGAEVLNAGLPGFVRTYWDAYSLGALLAAAMMFFGGAWYLLAGIRTRQSETEG